MGVLPPVVWIGLLLDFLVGLCCLPFGVLLVSEFASDKQSIVCKSVLSPNSQPLYCPTANGDTNRDEDQDNNLVRKPNFCQPIITY